MGYGKFKMVMNPKGAEEARRKQEKEKRNPNRNKKRAPIVKFGNSIDSRKERQLPRRIKPEKRPLPRPLTPGGDKKGPGPINKPGIKGPKRPRSNDVIRNKNIPPSVLGRVSIMGTPKPRKRGNR